MKKVMRIYCNGNIDVLDVPGEITCSWVAEQIGCELIEVVHPEKLKEGFLMLVDEEGLLKENFINLIGSWLYGTEKHGSPIAGDIMVIRETYGPDGPDFDGMSDQEVEEMKKDLRWPADRLARYATILRSRLS